MGVKCMGIDGKCGNPGYIQWICPKCNPGKPTLAGAVALPNAFKINAPGFLGAVLPREFTRDHADWSDEMPELISDDDSDDEGIDIPVRVRDADPQHQPQLTTCNAKHTQRRKIYAKITVLLECYLRQLR